MILLVEDIKNIKIKDNDIPPDFIKNKYSVYEYQIIKDSLDNYYNINNFVIRYTENGKPYFENIDLFFSISHDKDFLAICFDYRPIGIDLQFYNKDSLKIKKLLNIDAKNSKEVIDIFSKREAVIKLEGKTLKDINNVDIEKYDIKSFSNSLYTLNIANFF